MRWQSSHNISKTRNLRARPQMRWQLKPAAETFERTDGFEVEASKHSISVLSGYLLSGFHPPKRCKRTSWTPRPSPTPIPSAINSCESTRFGWSWRLEKKSLYSNFLKGLRYFMNPKISLARTRFLEIANFQWKNTSATVASSGWTRKKMMAAAIAPPACRGGRNTESWSYDLSFFSCGTECYWTSLKFSLKYIYIWIH